VAAPFPQTPSQDLSRELVRRIQDGDELAWDELYRLYHDELLFTIRANLGARLRGVLESEDVLQSAALEALRALPRFEHRGHGSLRGFLHKLVLNKIRDRADTFGAKKRAGGVPLTDTMQENLAGAEPRYFDGERFERLERGLGALPAEMRQVILLRRLEDRTYDEIARAMDRSESAVRKLYSRAMARLSIVVDASGA
jgi:RNA polymerase sigma-70 factor (ECF subfamily)